MPIRPEQRHRYPADWRRISHELRAAAGWRCQGTPAFPHCRAEHLKPHPETGSRVVLTVAHLDHTPENNTPENLRVLCQRCHLHWDREHHQRNAAETIRKKKLDRFQHTLETAQQVIRGMRNRVLGNGGNNNGAPAAPVEERQWPGSRA